jgi:hypothetical protein
MKWDFINIFYITLFHIQIKYSCILYIEECYKILSL